MKTFIVLSKLAKGRNTTKVERYIDVYNNLAFNIRMNSYLGN